MMNEYAKLFAELQRRGLDNEGNDIDPFDCNRPVEIREVYRRINYDICHDGPWEDMKWFEVRPEQINQTIADVLGGGRIDFFDALHTESFLGTQPLPADGYWPAKAYWNLPDFFYCEFWRPHGDASFLWSGFVYCDPAPAVNVIELDDRRETEGDLERAMAKRGLE